MFGWFSKKKPQEKKFDDGLMKHVNKKMQNNPLNNFSQFRRFLESGHGHEADGNLEEALICYQTSLKLRDTPMAHYDIAGVLIRMGRPHEALDELRTAQAMACPADLAKLIEDRLASLG